MNKSKYKILVTGAAGFIGSALVKKLIYEGHYTIGIDNINNYYSQALKYDRLKDLESINASGFNTWKFEKCNLENFKVLKSIFEEHKPDIVVNLAAQAGVRYSIENPSSYISSNLQGFGNILEFCKEFNIKNLIYASSSSVYGGNVKIPFQENDPVNHPISLYAATKKANELMAHTYSHIHNFPSTGLRFFTVYGPWGRPDMAPMIFARSIFERKPIQINNYGNMKRDFTYIEDIVNAIYLCCLKPATPNSHFDNSCPEASTSFAPHRIFNIGFGKPINLMSFIEILENEIGIKAIKKFRGPQPGDVIATGADTNKLKSWIGISPEIPLEKGINLFVKWFRNYYKC